MSEKRINIILIFILTITAMSVSFAIGLEMSASLIAQKRVLISNYIFDNFMREEVNEIFVPWNITQENTTSCECKYKDTTFPVFCNVVCLVPSIIEEEIEINNPPST